MMWKPPGQRQTFTTHTNTQMDTHVPTHLNQIAGHNQSSDKQPIEGQQPPENVERWVLNLVG